ncbi:MAG: hypothetical protein HY832_03465 [Candidatus Aenigmarchaeota archaeon]|nr:hypothetical protein [Candidatus Aenigmarchaeota archaeon]
MYHSSKKQTLVVEPLLNGNELGVLRALNFLVQQEQINDDLLVIGGDNFFDFSFASFIQYFQKHAGSVVALYQAPQTFRYDGNYGIGFVNASKRITDFEEKPKDQSSNLIGTCCYFFTKYDLKLLQTFIHETSARDIGTFIHWLCHKSDVYAYIFDTRWFDIGDMSSLKQAGTNVREMNKNLLRRMLAEEVFDLRWSSCLRNNQDMVNGYGPVLDHDPLEKTAFESAVEKFSPVGYQNDVKLASSIAQALLFLKRSSGKKQAIIVGKDIRAGTDFIIRSFIQTLLQDPDVTVLYVGEASTAYVSYCVNHLSKTHDIAFGVQLSGSHTAWYKIGVEPLYGSYDAFHIAGSPFDADDLQKLREQTAETEIDPSLTNKKAGAFQNMAEPMFEAYRSHVVALAEKLFGPSYDARGAELLMLLDTGNNVSRKFVEPIFDHFGVNYKIINKEYKYIPNRTNDPNHASVREMMQDRCNLINHTVLGVAFDTDADRSAFFNNVGDSIPGDVVGFLLAQTIAKKENGFYFQFESNNHLGVPIIHGTKKNIVCTVDAGLFIEALDDVAVKRVSIGKPFLYSEVSRLLKERDFDMIAHCDGPFISLLFYMVCVRLLKKGKTLKESIEDALPELRSYAVLRSDVDLSSFVNVSSKTHMETKRAILMRTLDAVAGSGMEKINFDFYTGIVQNKDLRIFLRCSGHENFIIRASVEGRDKDVVQETLGNVIRTLQESARVA